MREYENLIGQRFGKLGVKELLPSNNKGHRRWNCLCDCGNMHIATTGNLKNGHTTNYGCGKSPDLIPVWECRCECGEIVYRESSTLTNQKERMCIACLRNANAETMTQSAGFVGGTQLPKIQEMKLSSANTSGTRGVYWHKKQNKWYVRLKFQGKLLYFGSYSNYDDAVKARQQAEEEIFGKFLLDIDM